ncbi:hypothetical protein CgunFtcFv8_002213 [Champsocephalus gunnari]|uniref:BLUF domain-containing protein n=1 Tax=Champsocephalus gunnari TaxID=52237 RepID=A0AAN8H861_CHAGU|nr:hypothetical protein CgunFtcFv8_002213 [Champsocephalus gunnari]
MTEKSLEKITSFSWDRDSEDMEEDSATMFNVFNSHMRERIVLQRLIVIARLPHDLADRTELGAHYERLNFQLSKRYSRDLMTGRLYIYPSCLLHIIESSREVLLSVLTDLKDMQHHTHGALLEAPRVVFMAHHPQSRLFQQWSYKAVPGSVWDETPELIASQRVLYILLAREELLTPQQHLQMYNSPLDIHMDFGQVIRSSRLTTV